MRSDLARSPFQGEGHRKVHARLRILDDIRVSRTRVLRVMRAQGLLSPHRGRQGEMKAHDGTIVTSAPDVMWGYPCFYRQARAEYSQANGLYVLARQVTDAPLDLVAHGPASLTIHGVVFPCRARSAGDGPAGGSAPVDAPARSAPELVHPRQNVPRPCGRAPDRLPPRRPVAGVPSW